VCRAGRRGCPSPEAEISVFEICRAYSRNDVYQALDVPAGRRRGNWETGYTTYDGEVFIFANVGAPGRSGHDYDNQWIGEQLLWWGKKGSRLHQPTIRKILESGSFVHIFTRSDNRMPFIYAGRGHVVSTQDTSPVQVTWAFDGGDDFEALPEEIGDPQLFPEGATRRIAVNVFERDREARRICIQHYGYSCVVCGFDFNKFYGSVGSTYIHVHHLVPLSEVGGDYLVDPIKDLRPICANCHAMIHRRNPPLAIGELQGLIAQRP